MSCVSEDGYVIEYLTKEIKDVQKGLTNFIEGDVVFAKITPCMENGKSAIIGKLANDIGFGTTEFYVFRCNDKLYNKYLHYIFRDKVFRTNAKYYMRGSVGQQRLPKSYLENYILNLPPLEEQKEIVKILDSILSKEKQVK